MLLNVPGIIYLGSFSVFKLSRVKVYTSFQLFTNEMREHEYGHFRIMQCYYFYSRFMSGVWKFSNNLTMK